MPLAGRPTPRRARSAERLLRVLVGRSAYRDRFEGEAGRERFVRQIAASGPVVRLGVVVAILADLLLPGWASRVGAVDGIRRLLASSMELHRSPTPLSVGAAPSDDPRGDGTADVRPRPTEAFDEIIIGSGPGGAIAAFYAATAGRRVAIVEAGRAASSSASHSSDQLLADFRDAGQELILGRSIVPFAQGQVVGGGSEVNSGLYHRLPTHLRARWFAALGVEAEEWEDAEREVERLVPIERQSRSSLGSYVHSPIPQIAEHLGWEHAIIPRWRTYGDEGYRHHGMADTYLSRAVDAGATLLAGERALRADIDGTSVRVRTAREALRAKRLVVAAGATGTPGFIARSGMAPLRSASFGFHVMAKVAVSFPRTINDLVDIDPHQAWAPGGSAKIGVAASTPDLLRSALAGLGLPTSLVSGRLGVYYVSHPAVGRGGILRLGEHLQPWFISTPSSMQALKQHVAALEAAIEAVGGQVLAPGRHTLSTVHVFGSLPVGSSPLVNGDGVVAGTGGLVRVSDASLLPEAPAVNPQGPLMHLATVLARRCLDGR